MIDVNGDAPQPAKPHTQVSEPPVLQPRTARIQPVLKAESNETWNGNGVRLHASVLENLEPGTLIGTVTSVTSMATTDTDPLRVRFFLKPTRSALLFALDSVTGILTLRQALDYEQVHFLLQTYSRQFLFLHVSLYHYDFEHTTVF